MASLAELIQLQLEKGGRATLTVTGVSMYPMLRNCVDKVVLIPITGRQKKGDIIFYRRDNGQYILHRIISVTQEGYICCGDNQSAKEEVRHEQLLAVVDGYFRGEKEHKLTELGYQLYVLACVGLFPLRRYILALRRRGGRLLRKIRRWIKSQKN